MTSLNSGIWTPDGSVFLGWRQDLEQLPENQAYLASGPRFYLPSNFRKPVLIDPRPWMWEVGSAGKNQGPVGSCSGFGSSTGCEVDQWIDSQGAAHELFSAMFCYLMGQRLAGITGDNGCTISAVVESLTRNGVPRDRTFPYPGRYTSDVPDEAIAEAAKHKILRHHKFSSYDEVYQFLASGQGVIVIGIPWTRELADNRDGIVENPGTEVLGGHCNVLVGLSKRTDRAGRNYGIDINSHGLAWGYKGTAEFSPAVIDHYGADGYSELIGISKLEAYEDGPRRTSWLERNPW